MCYNVRRELVFCSASTLAKALQLAEQRASFFMSKKDNFLLSFFNHKIDKEVKEVNGYILVKATHGLTGKQYVQIYTKKSYDQYLKMRMENSPEL